MGKIFDCRFKDVIQVYDRSDDGTYLVIIDTDTAPEFDDFLVTKSGDIMVFDYVKNTGLNSYEGRLVDVDMVLNTRKVPRYRDLKRAVLSQLKRDNKRYA